MRRSLRRTGSAQLMHEEPGDRTETERATEELEQQRIFEAVAARAVQAALTLQSALDSIRQEITRQLRDWTELHSAQRVLSSGRPRRLNPHARQCGSSLTRRPRTPMKSIATPITRLAAEAVSSTGADYIGNVTSEADTVPCSSSGTAARRRRGFLWSSRDSAAAGSLRLPFAAAWRAR